MKVLIDMFYAVITNFPLMVALVSMAIAQAVKIIYYYFKDGEVDFIHVIEAGGMPSAHSAMVSSLSVSIGLTYGWNSPAFAICLIFSLVVMYDAMGVRRAASKQAFILNKIVDEIYITGKDKIEKLKEIMGHSPLEVVIGLILGILLAFVMYALVYVMI